MRDGVTLKRRLSFAGRKPRISPEGVACPVTEIFYWCWEIYQSWPFVIRSGPTFGHHFKRCMWQMCNGYTSYWCSLCLNYRIYCRKFCSDYTNNCWNLCNFAILLAILFFRLAHDEIWQFHLSVWQRDVIWHLALYVWSCMSDLMRPRKNVKKSLQGYSTKKHIKCWEISKKVWSNWFSSTVVYKRL